MRRASAAIWAYSANTAEVEHETRVFHVDPQRAPVDRRFQVVGQVREQRKVQRHGEQNCAGIRGESLQTYWQLSLGKFRFRALKQRAE